MKLTGCLQQFNCSNCSLEHSPANNFIKSQWQKRTHSKLYLAYRWLIGLYFLSVVIVSMSNPREMFWYFFIYMTNWGIMLCGITTMYGAILVTIYYCHPNYSESANDIVDMPTSFKVYWWFHNITLVLSLVITIIYWGVLFDETHELSAVNIMTHATNSVLMFLDMLIVSHPYRLYHVIQPMLFGVVYAIFSVIYYYAGGVDVKGNPFIYFILDWRKPGEAMTTIVMVIALCVAIHIVLCFIYYIRTRIFIKYFYKEEDLLPTSHTNSQIASANKVSMVFEGHDNRVFDMSSEDRNK